jgi:DNA (cytosine-5)-methyltransferase 1
LTAYYNEFDKKTAAWLRGLIKNGLIADGVVDERSIEDVKPEDLRGFTQCHFFAGIGGWSYALRLAGVPDDFPCWTGSPPCQPFSVAGKQVGFNDPRHLAPKFLELIAECKPAIVFGEQVAAAIGKNWLDFVLLDLEAENYTCGAAVLPACSVGAPHKRDRLFFAAANALAHTSSSRHLQSSSAKNEKREPKFRIFRELPPRFSRYSLSHASSTPKLGYNALAYTNDYRQQPSPGIGRDKRNEQGNNFRRRCEAGSTSNTNSKRPQRERANCDSQGWEESDFRQARLCNGARTPKSTVKDKGFWSGTDWIGCRDGKFRPVRSGTQPLANGIPARVVRLRGYGNSIVPQVAAEFVDAFLEALHETKNFPQP